MQRVRVHGKHMFIGFVPPIEGETYEAGVSLLEVYRPLTGWKSERDVMRHPRKYLPPAAALLAVMAVHVLAP